MIVRKYKKIFINENESVLTVEFSEKKFELLSVFLFADGSAVGNTIIEKIREIYSGLTDTSEVIGNVCCVKITKDYTVIYDQLSDIDNSCKVNTSDIYELITEWLEKNENIH